MSTLFKTFEKGTRGTDVLVFASSKYIKDLHHHTEYEIFYLHSGSGIFYIENTSYNVSSGDVLFIEPNVDHSFTITSEAINFNYMVFKPVVFGTDTNLSHKTMEQMKINTKITLSESLINKFLVLSEKNKLKSFGLEIMNIAFLYEVISYLIETNQYMQYTRVLDNMDTHSKAVQITCKYIQQHYPEKLDYEDILNLSNYSKSQFIKIFKKETGMNITDYINQCRIEHACLDLLNTNKNITEIAIENGFNNIQYFSKRFKEIMNCTPKEYKSNILSRKGESSK